MPSPSKPIFNIKAIRLTFILCLLFIAIAIPATYLIAPRYAQTHYFSLLNSPQASERQQAYAYLAKNLSKQPELLASIPSDQLNNQNLLELASRFNALSRWHRSYIPADMYNRWVIALAEQPDPQSKRIALENIANHPDANFIHQCIPALKQLAQSTDATIPHANLRAMLQIYTSAAPADQQALQTIIDSLTQSSDIPTARSAWIARAIIQSPPDAAKLPRPELHKNISPLILEAALWSISQTNPTELSIITDYLKTPQTRPYAIYPLASYPPTNKAAQQQLLKLAMFPPENITPANQINVWRAILCLPRPNYQQKTITPAAQAIALQAEEPHDNTLLHPIVAAATYKAGIAMTEQRPYTDPFGHLIRLATIEGQINATSPQMTWYTSEDAPALLQIATQNVNASPSPAAFLKGLTSTDPTTQALAAHIASQTLSDSQIKLLISKLTESPSTQANLAIALLHALTGQASPQLIDSYIQTDNFTLSKTAEIARWLQNPTSPLSTDPKILLLSNHYPRSILLMLLLHSPIDDWMAGLDHLLLNPQFSNQDLIEFLDTKRFYYILTYALPDDAPQLWLWADPQLQSLQLDTLRLWYLLYRNNFNDGMVY